MTIDDAPLDASVELPPEPTAVDPSRHSELSLLSGRLKLAMRDAGLSQVALAKACGIKGPSVHNWLSGKSQSMRGKNLLFAALALGVSELWLATGRGPMRDPKLESMDHNCDMTTFGQRLREARKQAGMTQPELAKAAKLSQTTISDIERERNSGSSEVTLLARALGVFPEWLAEGKGPMRESQLESNDSGPAPVTWLNIKADWPPELITAYFHGAEEKKEALLLLARLPDKEMAGLVLVLRSIAAKYRLADT